jgi:NADPH:quinone reductase-like Zn-dependent oxidoreductase
VATDLGGPEVLTDEEVELPPPGPGEVTLEVRAAGMNPADYKGFSAGGDRSRLPRPLGFEVAGVIAALGPDTEIGSGGGAVGDEVLAFQVTGGWASALTVPADTVLAKPAGLGFPEAANLLLVGATAADALNAIAVTAGDTLLVHGASGAVGVSVLQQARLLGARVIGTASERNFPTVRRFGAVPVTYGDGLADRVRAAAPGGVTAAIDTVGTDEAVEVSLQLVPDPDRVISVAAFGRGIRTVSGGSPESVAFRHAARARLIAMAAAGDLVVPIGRTFPLGEVRDAVRLLMSGHPGGKLALIPER